MEQGEEQQPIQNMEDAPCLSWQNEAAAKNLAEISREDGWSKALHCKHLLHINAANYPRKICESG